VTDLTPDIAEDFDAALEAVVLRTVEGCIAMTAVERLSGGASQETYRITIATDDGEFPLAMRRAPGGVGLERDFTTAPGLPTEALLMKVAGAAGVPEPTVHHVLEPQDRLGEGFIMEWLDGVTLGARIVRSPELDQIRPHLAYQCGEILARIHAIDLDATGLRQHLDTLDPEAFVNQMWDRYREYPTPQPMIDYSARWLLDNMPDSPVEQALVHNDFRNGNVMVDQNGVNAVLDWEVAHIGDPMRDLGWICTNSWRFGRRDLPVGGFGQREDLFAGYEAVSGTAVDPERVKWWEVFGSYWWAVGCLGMADHYRTGPDKTVERPGIGRRSSECQVDCVNLIIPGEAHLVEPVDLTASADMPRLEELLGSVRNFLHADVMDATEGRTNFLARVAGNSLDIVLREIAIGPELWARSTAQLQSVLDDNQGDLTELRWDLVRRLRDGSIELDHPGLEEHLRETVVNQVAIDQPRYSGYRHAAGLD
jgi:aminoglycoside phosphotransferase (APT) family kinase protein